MTNKDEYQISDAMKERCEKHLAPALVTASQMVESIAYELAGSVSSNFTSDLILTSVALTRSANRLLEITRCADQSIDCNALRNIAGVDAGSNRASSR